ncbi:hypothetical protein [Flavobacterium bizetiae]|uniref:hypothetical protein n=1 Tax=Flavobacterium bizetiae TaxID=2704140 RepID=UPI003756A408
MELDNARSYFWLYTIKGEIDLMKYVDENIRPTDYYSRVVIAPEDLLGLIWLTKIKVL